MRLQVLGHAGLRVNASDQELLCDPWLLGSSYWRSWWNYPPVPERLRNDLAPNFVYLTHLHWDHFHGPSLRQFPKTTRFLVPFIRYDRMRRDLRNLGFTNVTELAHGRRLELGPALAIRSYHFGPIFTDSALIIEAEGVVIFNANDAKLAGLPLRQILSDYPKVDFCLRSHSSANARRCMHIDDEPESQADDDSHYLATFSLFMRRVHPRFAIPFASNSCFLHKDVTVMNAFSQTPLLVKRYFEAFATRVRLSTELKIMIPGDQWTTTSGFTLAEHDYFEERELRLREYSSVVKPRLDQFYAIEAKVSVSVELIAKFFRELWMRTPSLLLRPLRGEKVLVVSLNADSRVCFAIDLRTGNVCKVAADQESSFAVRAEFPAIILAQSIRMNMFSQAWISKRVHYHATRKKMFVLKGFLRILELNEAELLPLRKAITWRSIRALVPRWREGLLYLHVVMHLLRGRTFLEIETRLLNARGATVEPLAS